jgi:hypothetical protein
MDNTLQWACNELVLVKTSYTLREKVSGLLASSLSGSHVHVSFHSDPEDEDVFE